MLSVFSPKIETEPIGSLLTQHTGFLQLLPNIEQIHALEKDLNISLPAYFSTHIWACPIKKDILTLLVRNSALAARLYHLKTRLIQELQQRAWQIHSIQIVVREPEKAITSHPKTAQLSKTGASCLHQLYQTLADSSLRSAVANILQRHSSIFETIPCQLSFQKQKNG